MNRKEKSLEIFRQSFNCSQAIFCAYRNTAALDEENSLKLATMFGAGVASTGTGLCGAVTGGLMAISMHHGRGSVEDTQAKRTTYELGRQFISDFTSQIGACTCEAILGINISSPENMKKALEDKLFETTCVDAVRTAAELLDEII